MDTKTFMLILRNELASTESQISPEMQDNCQCKWNLWIKELAVKDKVAAQIRRWDHEGRVVRAGIVSEADPYQKNGDVIHNIVLIYASDYHEASEIARDCPALISGGSIEVRMAL